MLFRSTWSHSPLRANVQVNHENIDRVIRRCVSSSVPAVKLSLHMVAPPSQGKQPSMIPCPIVQYVYIVYPWKATLNDDFSCKEGKRMALRRQGLVA